ncbi:MAG: class I SAM-dependent methyltransferase [Proteobacteria bacterium]|nr:class I SAM-dependent methyltransferase [Pseudomonadota bacterium]
MGGVRVLSTAAPPDFPDEWYETLGEGHFWLEWRFAVFRNLVETLGLPLDARWRGLDIGCGHGEVRRQIEAATSWVTDGADLKRSALEQNETASGDGLLYDIHDRRPELHEHYDFILLFDVIEHLKDEHGFLESALYHLKPGGWVFINVPALDSMSSGFDAVVGHHRRYNRRTLLATAERAGLDIRELHYWGFSMLPYLVIRKLLTSRGTSVRRTIERGVQPPAPWMTSWVERIQRIETRWLRRPPLGTSLIMAAVKP